MKVLFVGDVVGKPGRQALAALLPAITRERAIDLVIVNGENAAGGAGLTAEIAREIHDAGADVVTNGNHVWDQRAFIKEIDALDYCLRPLNLPPGNPGRGWTTVKGALVVNALGRVFMAQQDDPFRAMDALLEALGDKAPAVRILDWHAEATSEKLAMGWLGTLVLGLIGSFVGGTLAALIFDRDLELSASGLIGSIVGAIIVLLLWRAMRGGRRLTT